MGPQEWAMEMANHLIAKYALTVDQYDFAYAIQAYIESLPDDDEDFDNAE